MTGTMQLKVMSVFSRHSFTMLSYVYFMIVLGSHLVSDCWTLATMASIFDESKRPLRVLQQLPTSHTSVQVKFTLPVDRESVDYHGDVGEGFVVL